VGSATLALSPIILIGGSGVARQQHIDVNDDELPKTKDADTRETPGSAGFST